MSPFVKEQLTPAEEDLILEFFAAPTTKKYLRVIAQNEAEELLTLSSVDMKPEALKSRHDFVSGKLAVITTLLSITKEN